jgi:hypothetical protein
MQTFLVDIPQMTKGGVGEASGVLSTTWKFDMRTCHRPMFSLGHRYELDGISHRSASACSRHPTANGRISTTSVIAAGCRPSRIASTMSGARVA